MSRLIDADELHRKLFEYGCHKSKMHPMDVMKMIEEQPTANVDKDVRTEAYNKGLEDGRNEVWELAKKIASNHSEGGFSIKELIKIFGIALVKDIFKEYSAQEALAKLEAYEKEQAEIKVGDVVTVDNGDIKFICTQDNSNGDYTKCHLMASDGSTWEECNKKILVKTGKHIDIQSILQQIGGDLVD